MVGIDFGQKIVAAYYHYSSFGWVEIKFFCDCPFFYGCGISEELKNVMNEVVKC